MFGGVTTRRWYPVPYLAVVYTHTYGEYSLNQMAPSPSTPFPCSNTCWAKASYRVHQTLRSALICHPSSSADNSVVITPGTHCSYKLKPRKLLVLSLHSLGESKVSQLEYLSFCVISRQRFLTELVHLTIFHLMFCYREVNNRQNN